MTIQLRRSFACVDGSQAINVTAAEMVETCWLQNGTWSLHMANSVTFARVVLPIALASSTPFLLISVYLCLAHWPKDIATTHSDIVATIISLSVGAFWLFFLPVSIVKRLVIIAVFYPCEAALLFFYSLEFLGVVFNEWM
jgi:hypothetical protein